MKRWVLSIALSTLVASCGGSNSGGPGGQTCLTDQQICQFHAGVSTTADVRNAIGPPEVSQSVSNGGTTLQQWVYICQSTAQTTDVVQFIFESDVLQTVGVTRSGANTTPPPTCGP